MVTAVAAALFVSPLAANAAGMGKINVLSALGEPLRAELDVTATREEAVSLSARVAPPEAFRQANLEYASVLSSLRFTLEKRPDGKPYFKITSERPVSDPFIDMLVELSWSSGRLVREYAFLLDPPELKASTTTSGVVAAPAVTPAQPPAKAAVPVEPAAPPAPPKSAESVTPQPPAPPTPTPSAEAGAASHEVKSGDTLSKIAKEYAVEGATLNQMLVALFNSNREAFSGGNMNRLRAGKILNIPDAATVAAVDTAEARKIVVAQAADFNAYRNALAGAAEQQAPSEGQAAQSSTGKIAPKVEEAAPAEAGKDKLQVSRGAEAGTAGKPSEEDRIAREKALQEANTRVAELEKNLTDLKQLAEMKSQAAGAPAAADGATPPEAPQPAPAAPAPTVETPPVAAPAAPAENQLPPQKAKPPVTANALPPPSFIEENPALVFGGGAAILALLGLFGYRGWKRKREDAIDRDAGATLNEPATSLFGATSTSDSVDRTTGGLSNFSNSTLDAADTGKSGVDPIQEAEVYMAYGRDIQAEEILRDALAKDPANIAIVSKLLEIYAARKSVAQFNELAVDLRDRTSGNGSAWTKAAELGRGIDPENPLYGGAVAPVVEDLAALETPAVAEPVEPPLAEETIDKDELPEIIDFDLDLDAPAEAGGSTSDTSGGLDFDLDLGDDQPAPQEDRAAGDLDIDLEAPPAPDNVIDFDLGGGEPANDAEPAAAPLDLSSISLDLDNVAPSGSDSSEVASKLELAQAYEEMGDREGARELLQEVIAEGSSAQQEAARKKLAELE